MLEKKVKKQKIQLSVFNTENNPGSENEESYGPEKEYGNRKHSYLTHQGKYKSSKKAWYEIPRSIDCRDLVGGCIKFSAIHTIKLVRVQSVKYLQSNKSTMEIYNHAYTKVLGSNFLPINNF